MSDDEQENNDLAIQSAYAFQVVGHSCRAISLLSREGRFETQLCSNFLCPSVSVRRELRAPQ